MSLARHGSQSDMDSWSRVQEGAPKNPRAVGEAIVKNLAATDLLAEQPSLAGPGFINIRISAKWLGKRVGDILSRVCPLLIFS